MEFERLLEAPLTELLRRCDTITEDESSETRTLLQAYRNVLLCHESPNTRNAYRRDLDWFVGIYCEYHDRGEMDVLLNLHRLVTRSKAIWYRDTMRSVTGAWGKPLADATISRRLAVMSTVFREFHRSGLIQSNPFKGLTVGYRCDPTPALSNEDRQKLVRAPDYLNAETIDDRQRLLRDRILLILLFVHGIRREEARLVKASDIGESQGHPVLSVRQKGGNTILHRLHPKLAEYIELYRSEFMSDPDGCLFTGLSNNGRGSPDKPISPQAINWIVKHYAKKVGITQRISPHVGRATVITLALQGGAPLQVVSHAIGHASIETTARYDRSRNRMDQAVMLFQDCEL